jgi:hypothetical protein
MNACGLTEWAITLGHFYYSPVDASVNRFAAAAISTRRRTLKNAAATDSAKVC